MAAPGWGTRQTAANSATSIVRSVDEHSISCARGKDNQHISASLTAVVTEHLGVPADRLYFQQMTAAPGFGTFATPTASDVSCLQRCCTRR